jgi:flavin reductase (DIM6/NTAB) family NADH-FMN oxidoreductase RutF
LRAVLAQLESRPVVVAAGLSGWIATIALGADASNLAAGLVLVDLPIRTDQGMVNIPERLRETASKLNFPTLLVHGGFEKMTSHPEVVEFQAGLPQGESIEIGSGELLVVTDRTEAFIGVLLDFLDRKQPKSGVEFRAGSDARTLRDAMGCFATGITILTACDEDGRPIGLTANSFTSLSLDPPLLLVCVANNARTASVLRNVACFGVNVLQIGQQPSSNQFANFRGDRFADMAWSHGETGVPLLNGSLVSFECSRDAVHEGGDHFILVGEVVRAQFDPRRDPLLYFRGKYRRLHVG